MEDARWKMLDGVIDEYYGLSQAVSVSIYLLLRYAGEWAVGVFFFPEGASSTHTGHSTPESWSDSSYYCKLCLISYTKEDSMDMARDDDDGRTGKPQDSPAPRSHQKRKKFQVGGGLVRRKCYKESLLVRSYCPSTKIRFSSDPEPSS
jgi:hypothetical protein